MEVEPRCYELQNKVLKNTIKKQISKSLTIGNRMRAEMAGYPVKYFSFHSFRSGITLVKLLVVVVVFTYLCTGFIVSHLLEAYGDTNKMHAAMLHTAWVAQWQAFSRSMNHNSFK